MVGQFPAIVPHAQRAAATAVKIDGFLSVVRKLVKVSMDVGG